MRCGHAKAAEIPIEFARLRMDHASNEVDHIARVERNKHSIQIDRSERCVMNVRRQRMANGPPYDAKDLSVPIDTIDSVNVAQLASGNLSRRASLLGLKRGKRQKRSA